MDTSKNSTVLISDNGMGVGSETPMGCMDAPDWIYESTLSMDAVRACDDAMDTEHSDI